MASSSKQPIAIFATEVPFLGRSFDDARTRLLPASAWAILSATYSDAKQTKITLWDQRVPHHTTTAVVHVATTINVAELESCLQEALQAPQKADSRSDNDASFQQSSIPDALISVGAFQSAEFTDHPLVIGFEAGDTTGDVPVLQGLYNTQILSGQLVERIVKQLAHIMDQLNQGTVKKIGELELVSDFDKTRLQEPNREMPPLQNLLVHEVIEAQAQHKPVKEAVCAWDGTLTYEELDQRAHILAMHIIAAGVKVGDYVSLLFEKSKWYIVSILAVLKAGAAFVPLDQAMPEARVKTILEQFERLPLILALRSQSSKLNSLNLKKIFVDDQSNSSDLKDSDLPTVQAAVNLSPRNPAYVIFTSGTTGTPKGAIIPHAQLCTTMRALEQEIGSIDNMRSLHMSACNFDMSILEIFCPLVGGGCICIPSESGRVDNLAGAIESLKANFGSFSPSKLSPLVEHDFPTLKTILLAGERVPADLSDYWTSHNRRVVHLYGPSECTVGCCFLDANAKGHYTGSIGYPLANKIWIVDAEDHERLLPIGAPGEIIVEGPIVGKGYLRNEEKTRESFIESPKWFGKILDRQPSRFYKTGDLGRQTEEGGFEVIGRKDSQTKIGGIRVEVQEVEHHIREAFPTEIEVAVEVRNPDDAPGHQKLVAFLQMREHSSGEEKSDGEPDVAFQWDKLHSSKDSEFSKTVRQVDKKLRESLPDHMIPELYIPIQDLPIKDAYKMDRGALKSTADHLGDEEVEEIAAIKEM